MRANFKSWRESASVILVAKTAFAPHLVSHDFNYKLLTLQRSKQAGFMPGTYVFPGGNVAKADSSADWLKLYEKFGFKSDTFDKLNPKENRPQIYTNNEKNEIPKYISLRITAIRETFEESGILICRSFKINYKERLARWASFIGGHEVQKWQEKVHNDPLQFFELCSQYEVYPDVWSLKEWSNWATPPSIPLRFDTVFFLAAFQQMPPTVADKTEVQHLQWATPMEYVTKNKTEEVLLPPPQFYEISRLKNFIDIDDLLRFAADRAHCGSERYFPYRINTETGVFSILPGDDLYPEEVDPTNEAMTYMKNIPETKTQNRIEHVSVYQNRIITKNFTPRCNHVAPLESKL